MPRMFYDPVSETVFNSTLRNVLIAEWSVNHQLSTFEYFDAKDWVWMLGIEVTDNDDKISEIGWNVGIAETWFGDPYIEFWHEHGNHEGIETIDIHMSYFPKEDYYDF